MTNEEVKVFLQYTKVLLAIHKVKDRQVNEALDRAIDTFTDEKEPERNYFI